MQRDSKGRFNSEHGQLDILKEMDSGEVYTAPELNQATGIPISTTYHYLKSLHEDGKITRKNSNGTILWIKS